MTNLEAAINIPLVVNTHSKNMDLWPMFYGQLKKYWNGPVITFVNDNIRHSVAADLEALYPDHEIVCYDSYDRFRDQYLESLKSLRSYDALINANEDYILTGPIDFDAINNYYYLLKSSDYSVFRLVIGNHLEVRPIYEELEYMHIDNNSSYIYSQTMSIWKIKDLIKLHKETPNSDIGGTDMSQQFEVLANDTFYDLDLKAMCRWNSDAKPRGLYHNDCVEIPHTASALVKGKWNLAEYKEELTPLLKEYNIDPMQRGLYQ